MMTGSKTGATKRKVKTKSPAKGLLDALKFVSAGQKKNGNVTDTHVCILNGVMSSYSKGLSLGTPINEEITGCPHSATLASALRKCGKTMALTQLDNNSLVVTSGKFTATIPCVSHETMALSLPDPQCGQLDENVRQGFRDLVWLIDENAPKAYATGIMLTDRKMIAVDGKAIIEYWHGVNLPPSNMIPKAAVVAVCKQEAALTGFGFTSGTFTFWFENGSFVKTALISTPFPNTDSLFPAMGTCDFVEVTSEFIDAIDAVKDFTDTSLVYFIDGEARSHYNGQIGGKYACDCILHNCAYNANDLSVAVKLANKFYFPEKGHAIFIGDSLRGALTQGKI